MVAPFKYIDAHPRKHALRVQCQVALSQLLAQLGVDGTVPASRTASRAGGVVALETAFAHSQLCLTRLSH
jgi:D-alanyl-D-alanine carboxypeptidase